MLSRGQISSEAVIAVAIVLFIGLVMAAFSVQKNSEAEQLFVNFSSKAECEKISTIIYSISKSSAKASVVFELSSDASISDGIITVGEYYCDFLGSAQDYGLSVGYFKASKNSQGVVVFEKLS